MGLLSVVSATFGVIFLLIIVLVVVKRKFLFKRKYHGIAAQNTEYTG
jgi:hypothetical protein